MKPISCLVTAAAAVAFAATLHAQVDCSDWNTDVFFEAAEISDVTQCLQAGADLEARSEMGNTSLHMAAATGNAKVIAVLAAAGANLEARDEKGFTPLHTAAVIPGNAEAIAALLQAGADPKVRNNSDELPFDYARDNEKLQGTDAYWELYQAQFE